MHSPDLEFEEFGIAFDDDDDRAFDFDDIFAEGVEEAIDVGDHAPLLRARLSVARAKPKGKASGKAASKAGGKTGGKASPKRPRIE